MTWLDRSADRLWETICHIRAGLDCLDPRSYLERGEDQKSGGLKSKAYDVQIRRGSDRPIPVADDGGQKDPHDRMLDRENKRYETTIARLEKMVSELRDAETARERGTQICVACDGPIADSPRRGMCESCYRKELRREKNGPNT